MSRILRSAGTTVAQSLNTSKNYKFDQTGTLVEATSIGNDDIVFSGSKSSLRRIADLERNVSILAARTQTEDGQSSGYYSNIDYASRAGRWSSSRTITLAGDLSGNVSIDGSSNVTLTATIGANSVALGTDTTGNYVASLVAGTGITLSNNSGEGATPTVAVDTSTIATQSWVTSQIATKDNTDEITEGSTNLYFTNARARAAVSFTAGSGAYNSTTGVFTIPTNTNQLTNGAGFITGYTETDTLASVTGRGASTATAITISNSTASTTKTTGALIVTGGVGISGAVYVGGEVTAYASDSALKTNVVAIDNALSKVEAIRGVAYDWNEAGVALGLGTDRQVGVIAQEVEAVLPELVVQSAHEGYKTVKYDKLTALLIEAVKDLSAKVKTLEAQLNSKPDL